MLEGSSVAGVSSPLFTVFTPTFNRAHTLPRVYESLRAQTCRDFEWLIVDDGSSDGTDALVEVWRREADFPIRYISQENAGKHIAFNRGVREARGQLFLPLDSDDGCVPEALERLSFHWESIPEDERVGFSAVTVSCQDQDGRLVGSCFPFDPTDSNSIEIRAKYGVEGEKWGFQRTEVLRRFPFPEALRRTYVPESVVWERIARHYKTRYVNEPLRIYWMDAPSTVNHVSPARNARGRAYYCRLVLNEQLELLPEMPLRFVKTAVNYSRSSFHAGEGLREQREQLDGALPRALWGLALPVGALIYTAERGREALLQRIGRSRKKA